MRLQAIHNMLVGLEQHGQLAGPPIPRKHMAAIRAGHHIVAAPKRRLLDHCPRVPVAGELHLQMVKIAFLALGILDGILDLLLDGGRRRILVRANAVLVAVVIVVVRSAPIHARASHSRPPARQPRRPGHVRRVPAADRDRAGRGGGRRRRRSVARRGVHVAQRRRLRREQVLQLRGAGDVVFVGDLVAVRVEADAGARIGQHAGQHLGHAVHDGGLELGPCLTQRVRGGALALGPCIGPGVAPVAAQPQLAHGRRRVDIFLCLRLGPPELLDHGASDVDALHGRRKNGD